MLVELQELRKRNAYLEVDNANLYEEKKSHEISAQLHGRYQTFENSKFFIDGIRGTVDKGHPTKRNEISLSTGGFPATGIGNVTGKRKH